ncbi:M56 family metallopeptidase [Dyella sp.]|uniref:M56 family metallopeptidase n=1 Tax=Dyella sp. TaxID=1869338 RepID=UPI002ED1576D
MHALFDTWLERMAWTSLQAVLLFGVVWLLARFLPRLTPAIRCMLWWLVGLQLLLGLAVGSPLRLPLLKPLATESATPTAMVRHDNQPVTVLRYDHADTAPVLTAKATSGSLDWRQWLFAAWAAGVLLQLLLVSRQALEAWRTVRAATPLREGPLFDAVREQSHAMGLHRHPALRLSDDITSPQVMAGWRPVVLLPADHGLTPEESAMAIAHELAHLRRGDLWLGWIPALAQGLFFFHPLARWATREYALNREAACDAQVMARHRHTEAQTYGRLLLRLGVAQPLPSGLAGASPTFQTLKRRLTMLQQSINDSSPRARGWLLVALIACAGVLPYRVTTASPGMISNGQATQSASDDTTPLSPAPTAAPHPMPHPQRVAMVSPGYGPGPLPPPPPMPPHGPMPLPPPPPAPPAGAVPPPPPPPPPSSTDMLGVRARHMQISMHDGARNGIALIDGDNVMFDGDITDAQSIKRMSKNGPMLWVRRGDKAYVVRDAAFLKRVRDVYAPVIEADTAQGRLAGEQGRLAGEEGGLAAREGSFAGREGEIASERAALASERAALISSGADATARNAEIDARDRALSEREDDIRKEMDSQRADIQKQRQAIDKQRRDLDRQQVDLTRKQDQLHGKADAQIDKLINEAISSGAAQAVDV